MPRVTAPLPPLGEVAAPSPTLPHDGGGRLPLADPARRTLSPIFWEQVAVFFITLIVYAVFTPRMTTYLNPVSGDEPYYLMTAYSIIQDGDINECNNFRQHDFDKLYPDYVVNGQPVPSGWVGWTSTPYPLPLLNATIQPSRSCNRDPKATVIRGGPNSELYSLHGVGLSILIIPALALAGRLGVVFFLNILGALLAANIYLLAREGTGRRIPSLLTWLAFSFSVPLFAYSFVVFTEMPAALLLIYALRRIRLWNNNWAQMLGIGFCIGFLPSLHYRYLTLSVVLFAYYVYQTYRDRASFRLQLPGHIIALMIMVGGAILLFVRDLIVYHQLFPGSELYPTTDMPLVGAFGNFIDQQDGLFVVAPIMVLVIVGIIMMARQQGWRGELLWLALLFIPHFVLVSDFIIWWGSWAPPARYLVSALPLFVLPFALALDRIRLVWYKLIYALLMVPTAAMLVAYIYQPQWMYAQGHNQLYEEVIAPFLSRQTKLPVENFNLSRILPGFTATYYSNTTLNYIPMVRQAWQTSVAVVAIIVAIVLLSLAIYWWQQRKPRGFVSLTDDGPALQFAPPHAPPLRWQVTPRRLAVGGGLVALALLVYIGYNLAAHGSAPTVAASSQTVTQLPTPTVLQPQLIVPAGALYLIRPEAVAVDGTGNIYIGDGGTMSINKFDSAGHRLSAWQVAGGPNGDQSRKIADIAIYKDQLFVTTSPNRAIEVYSTDGKPLGQRTASGSDQLLQPDGLCLDASGNLYVADQGSQRILKLDSNDHLVATIGASDTLSAQQRLNGPIDCAVASDGAIYATDSQQRILKYGADGAFIKQWLLPLNDNASKRLALDGDRLYISDAGSNTVIVLNPVAQTIRTYGGPGNDPGLFAGLTGLASDAQGRIYTVETNNAWSQVFNRP